ncbi:nucleotidyltransferase family protein [Methanomicrobium antiquum]|uniref:protein adenylyltransferase n=1 Tax=Methanomicrobium antiquum TaxID=487686 RepID=A0AAF0FV39_9EURY|nr:nucleotidyltransferase family protein [Methanomicrobium antiquum]WFN37013.1 nucleotidyltransferase family protein [Methanomicrobium antiquum]
MKQVDPTKAILTKEEVISILKKEMPYLKEHFNVSEIALFGSYARDEADIKSDIDILVTYSKTPGMISFMKLENYLTDLFGVKVDLVLKNALRPNIGKSVLNEAMYA